MTERQKRFTELKLSAKPMKTQQVYSLWFDQSYVYSNHEGDRFGSLSWKNEKMDCLRNH